MRKGLFWLNDKQLVFTLCSPAILFADHAPPCRKTFRRMLPHPVGELRRAY